MHEAAGAASTATLIVTTNGADDAPVAADQTTSAARAYTAFDGVANDFAAARGLKTGASDVGDSVACLTPPSSATRDGVTPPPVPRGRPRRLAG